MSKDPITPQIQSSIANLSASIDAFQHIRLSNLMDLDLNIKFTFDSFMVGATALFNSPWIGSTITTILDKKLRDKLFETKETWQELLSKEESLDNFLKNNEGFLDAYLTKQYNTKKDITKTNIIPLFKNLSSLEEKHKNSFAEFIATRLKSAREIDEERASTKAILEKYDEYTPVLMHKNLYQIEGKELGTQELSNKQIGIKLREGKLYCQVNTQSSVLELKKGQDGISDTLYDKIKKALETRGDIDFTKKDNKEYKDEITSFTSRQNYITLTPQLNESEKLIQDEKKIDINAQLQAKENAYKKEALESVSKIAEPLQKFILANKDHISAIAGPIVSDLLEKSPDIFFDPLLTETLRLKTEENLRQSNVLTSDAINSIIETVSGAPDMINYIDELQLSIFKTTGTTKDYLQDILVAASKINSSKSFRNHIASNPEKLEKFSDVVSKTILPHLSIDDKQKIQISGALKTTLESAFKEPTSVDLIVDILKDETPKRLKFKNSIKLLGLLKNKNEKPLIENLAQDKELSKFIHTISGDDIKKTIGTTLYKTFGFDKEENLTSWLSWASKFAAKNQTVMLLAYDIYNFRANVANTFNNMINPEKNEIQKTSWTEKITKLYNTATILKSKQ